MSKGLFFAALGILGLTGLTVIWFGLPQGQSVPEWQAAMALLALGYMATLFFGLAEMCSEIEYKRQIAQDEYMRIYAAGQQ